MGVPAVEGERGNPRAVVGDHQFRRAARHVAHRSARIAARPCLHVVAARHLLELQALRQRGRERGILMPIEFDQPHRGIVVGIGQRHRRPAHGRRRAAQHQRRGRPDRERVGHALAARQRFQRAVEPAGLHAAGTGIAAFQHILARAEWLHVDLGTIDSSLTVVVPQNVGGPPVLIPQTTAWSRREQYDQFRLGISYRFH